MLRGKARQNEEQQTAARAALRPAPRPARPCLPPNPSAAAAHATGASAGHSAILPAAHPQPQARHGPAQRRHSRDQGGGGPLGHLVGVVLQLRGQHRAALVLQLLPPVHACGHRGNRRGRRGAAMASAASKREPSDRRRQHARQAKQPQCGAHPTDRLGPDSFGWPSLNRAAPAIKPSDAWLSFYSHAPSAPDHLGSNSFSACTASSCVESPSLIAASTEQRTTRLLSPSAHLRYLRGRRGWVGERREEGRLAARGVQARRAGGGRVRGPETGAAHAAASRLGGLRAEGGAGRPGRPQPSAPQALQAPHALVAGALGAELGGRRLLERVPRRVAARARAQHLPGGWSVRAGVSQA